MQSITRPSFILSKLSRRRFIQGLAALGLSPWLKTAQAKSFTQAQVLAGTEFNLTIAQTPVNFTGAPRMATTVNGSIPAPTLRWREGDTVTLHVTNHLAEETSIHWHGIILPYQMDGVPGISFKGIAPGETFTYRFKVQQSGTYWYHSHSGMQEQTGLYGSIIIDPAGTESIQADRDYVVQLSDWTDEDPMTVFAKLKKQSDYYNFNQHTAVDFFRDAADEGLVSAIQKATHVEHDAHEYDRPVGHFCLYLYLPHEWHYSGRQLDGAVSSGRAGAVAFYQCSFADLFRHSYPWT